MARAAKAKDKEPGAFRLMAKSTMLLGTAAAKRLQNSAENTADSYARAIRNAAEEAAGRQEEAEKARKEAKRRKRPSPGYDRPASSSASRHRAVGRGEHRPAGGFGDLLGRRRHAVLGERDQIAIAQIP